MKPASLNEAKVTGFYIKPPTFSILILFIEIKSLFSAKLIAMTSFYVRYTKGFPTEYLSFLKTFLFDHLLLQYLFSFPFYKISLLTEY